MKKCQTNRKQTSEVSAILQIMGDHRFHPNTSPQSTQGNTRTGLQAAKENFRAWLSSKRGAFGSAAVIGAAAGIYICIRHYLGADYFEPGKHVSDKRSVQ